MKIAIKATNMELTDPIRDYVNEKIGDVEKFYDGIIDARVEVGKTTNHHNKGDVFRAEVNLRVPEKGIIRAESTQSDLYMAITEVKNDLHRQLKSHKEKFNTKHKKMGRLMKRLSKLSPFSKE